ncbi:MAG: phosphoribosylaminoimidazolesuccinocarboxamide synthase [Actinomycetota bacterium]|nr:phosphoribosylaminoimidazolesuccinocarboxamide synthase [Actinomycetota bacterium]
MRHVYSGKVRDVYELDSFAPPRLLMVASDRVSAFDVVMAEKVPGKGQILTAMSCWFMDLTSDVVPNHLIECLPTPAGVGEAIDPDFVGRSVVTKRARMVELECIVRGHLAGSAFKEYVERGTVHGHRLPGGLRLASPLPEPIFCPSIKNAVGHDENISIERAREIFGADLVDRLAKTSLAVFARGSGAAAKAGIVLADTKFEFGYVDDELLLCDEVLTPDSSRFWDADALEPGREPVQFDKQPLRDYLESTGWEKTPPPPALPGEVLDTLAERYRSVYERITGTSFQGWLERAWAAASTGATPFGD